MIAAVLSLVFGLVLLLYLIDEPLLPRIESDLAVRRSEQPSAA